MFLFCSGKKPSTNEWCHFVEIMGTVRLTAFQDYLEQLPKSRSRAVTVTYFCAQFHISQMMILVFTKSLKLVFAHLLVGFEIYSFLYL